MGMDKLWESKQKLERINASDPERPSTTAPLSYQRTPGPSFEERHKRVTTYVENNLYYEIESLREQGKILNLKSLYNDALRDYLRNKYPNDSSRPVQGVVGQNSVQNRSENPS